MKKLLLLSVLLIHSTYQLKATHNRAGDISFKRVAPFTKTVNSAQVPAFNYSITVTKYHNYGNNVAFRCVDSLSFGDGTHGVARRVNGTSCTSCGTLSTCGDIVNLGNGMSVLVSIYSVVHEYPGTGIFKITSEDPNRNQDIINIPNSVNYPFTIEAQLVINNFSGINESPVIHGAAVCEATLNACFFHFPAATDADGDSLSYELTHCAGVNNYSYPDPGPGGTFAINGLTGQLTWCFPQQLGVYAAAYKVREWRKNPSGIYQEIGYVIRDMEITVIFAPVSITENKQDDLIELFPNPAENEFTISGVAGNVLLSCTILSLTGQTINKQEGVDGTEDLRLDLEALAPGIYFLHVKGSRGSCLKKIIRQ